MSTSSGTPGARCPRPPTGCAARCSSATTPTPSPSCRSTCLPSSPWPRPTEFADEADRETIRAFRLEPLESVVLHRGTWHWGPFPFGPRGAPVQRPGSALCGGQPLRRPGREGPGSRRRSHVRLVGRRRGADRAVQRPIVELDEAEKAEWSRRQSRIWWRRSGRRGGTDAAGTGVLHDHQPELVGQRPHLGGMVVAQALSAACRRFRPLEVHSLHGYFLRPTSPGSASIHAVERCATAGRSAAAGDERGRRQGDFRLTCSFHAPEPGDEYQLADRGRASRLPTRSRDSRRRSPSTSASSVPTEQRPTGHTSRRGVAGSVPASHWRTTRRSMPARWPISPT